MRTSFLYAMIMLWAGAVQVSAQAHQPSGFGREYKWQLRAAAGRYEIHEWKATGLQAEIDVARRFATSAIFFNLGATLGLGEDSFASLEPGLVGYLRLLSNIQLFAGVGAGFMLEGTLSLPYFARAGLDIRLSPRSSLCLTVRRGAHANTGDPGTFKGPHAVTAGVIYRW